jgi:hypothetical protein
MRIGAVTVTGCRREGSGWSGAISTRIADGQPVPVAEAIHCGRLIADLPVAGHGRRRQVGEPAIGQLVGQHERRGGGRDRGELFDLDPAGAAPAVDIDVHALPAAACEYGVSFTTRRTPLPSSPGMTTSSRIWAGPRQPCPAAKRWKPGAWPAARPERKPRESASGRLAHTGSTGTSPSSSCCRMRCAPATRRLSSSFLVGLVQRLQGDLEREQHGHRKRGQQGDGDQDFDQGDARPPAMRLGPPHGAITRRRRPSMAKRAAVAEGDPPDLQAHVVECDRAREPGCRRALRTARFARPSRPACRPSMSGSKTPLDGKRRVNQNVVHPQAAQLHDAVVIAQARRIAHGTGNSRQQPHHGDRHDERGDDHLQQRKSARAPHSVLTFSTRGKPVMGSNCTLRRAPWRLKYSTPMAGATPPGRSRICRSAFQLTMSALIPSPPGWPSARG